jgi:hypothetical protein
MFIAFLIVALIFLISGGVGLFYTNLNFGAGSHFWVYGNLTFGTFTLLGLVSIVLLAIFNSEFE